MAGDQPMVNPAEIAAELLHYACLARSRGTDRGRAELLGARALEAQQAEIERLRAEIDAINALFERWSDYTLSNDEFADQLYDLLHPKEARRG